MNENITPLTDDELAEITTALELTPAFIEASSRISRRDLGAAYSPTVVNALRLLNHSRALTARVKELEQALNKVERECRAITSEMAWDASDGRPSEAYVRTRFSDAANSINAVFDRAALNKEPTT